MTTRRGATLYVTMEPCGHHGTTPPCTEAVLRAGIARVVAGSLDPNPEAGGGLELLRAQGVEVEDADSFEARQQNEAWRTWVATGRPFVTLKLAVTLDGRVTVPGSRWVTGRRAAGACTSCARPRMPSRSGRARFARTTRSSTARDVEAAVQPRRLAFGRGPLPDGSPLELVSGPLVDELARLGAEGVQSLLLEGGPTLATAFLEADLVDRLLLFVAPRLAGDGPLLLGPLSRPLGLTRLRAEQVGDDVLLDAYVHEP